MRILFYAPFKPLNHPNPSGDVVMGRELVRFLTGKGHQVWPASELRCRWIYGKPWLWPAAMREARRAAGKIEAIRPSLWLTHHTYYKAPDILGPRLSRRAGLPYVVFQGIYSTKRKRSIKTLAGFLLNRAALSGACHVFANKKNDLRNLSRIIPPERLSYVAPGIRPGDFSFDPEARQEFRSRWGVGEQPVVLSAAMFRADVKTEGLIWVIRTCSRLYRQGIPLILAIAGDGRERERLVRTAEALLPGRVRFTGMIPRESMHRFYSAGDVFAFPGFNESFGMVFIEAQSCGLPAVAFRTGGIPEAVRDGETGLLVAPNGFDPFVEALGRLLENRDLRQRMGASACRHVRQRHDISVNYTKVEAVLERIARSGET